MKKMILVILMFAFSVPALAAKQTSLCGFNKQDGSQIRLSIVFEKAADEFSSPKILSINGETPRKVSDNEASGFGPNRYESVKLTMNADGCSGKAEYDHYNKEMPMNPMENLTLKCVCK